MQSIPDAVILHNLAPYLSLHDLAVSIITCKHIASFSVRLMKNVAHVDVPSSQHIRRFIHTLVVKCPNIRSLNIEHNKELHSKSIEDINKLPLTSFKCIGFEYDSYEKYFNDSFRMEFELPHLTNIYINMNEYKFDKSEKLTHIRLTPIVSRKLYDLFKFKQLKDVILDELIDTEFEDSKICDLPISQINVKLTPGNIDNIAKLPLKAFEMTDHSSVMYDRSLDLIKQLKLHKLRISERHTTDLDKLIEGMPLEYLELSGGKDYYPKKIFRLTNKSIKHLTYISRYVDFNCLRELTNLNTLRIEECDLLSYNIDILPIKELIIDKCLLLRCIANMKLTSLTIHNMHNLNGLCYLPVSLQSLIIGSHNCSYDGFPVLPNLKTLHIYNNNNTYGYDDSEDEMSSDDEDAYNTHHKKDKRIKPVISDEVWRNISLCPIQDLKIKCNSLTDNNVHYLTRMPINYLDIRCTNVTSVGLAKLRHLPLRKLIAPDVPTHHLLH